MLYELCLRISESILKFSEYLVLLLMPNKPRLDRFVHFGQNYLQYVTLAVAQLLLPRVVKCI